MSAGSMKVHFSVFRRKKAGHAWLAEVVLDSELRRLKISADGAGSLEELGSGDRLAFGRRHLGSP